MQNSDNKKLREEIVELLVDGPNSFASLYGQLKKYCGYVNLDIRQLAHSLVKMRLAREIEIKKMDTNGEFRSATVGDIDVSVSSYLQWLPDANFEDLAVDEVGLWCVLTTKGRRQRQSRDEEALARWAIDFDSKRNRVVIYAENEEEAHLALEEWLAQAEVRPEIVFSSKQLTKVKSFKLRSGTTVRNGVKVSYSVR